MKKIKSHPKPGAKKSSPTRLSSASPRGERQPRQAFFGDTGREASRREWIFNFAAITIIPLFFFLFLELGLRLFNYGYPASFFLKSKIEGRVVFTDNYRYGFRFFPRLIARAPCRFVIPAPKPDNAYRVFILGESAAMGEPAYEFGFGRILQALLEDYFPGKKIEVVNAAMTAINSHVVREIAEECAKIKPDLFVVYMGNNEVVGPYGVGTIFGSFVNRRPWIRGQIFLKSFKLGQLLSGLIPQTAKRENPRIWKGMAMFLDNQVRDDNAGLPVAYDYFRGNLEDIGKAAARGGAKVIVCTIGTNLKDCPPFASLHKAGLSAGDKKEWDNFFAAGKEWEKKGEFKEAIRQYRQAEKLDGQYAELAFRLARCFYASGGYDQARDYYLKARDMDTLRLRADTGINDIIRRVAAQNKTKNISLADIEKGFKENSPQQIPGNIFFYEHVHMNFKGNYLIARAILGQILKITPGRPFKPALSLSACAGRLGYDDWHRYKIVTEMIQWFNRAPFTHQLNNEERRKSLENDLAAYLAKPDMRRQRLSRYEELVEKFNDDWILRKNFAGILEDAHDFEGAVKQWRLVLRYVPHFLEVRLNLAMALAGLGRTGEAMAELREALKLDYSRSEIYNDIGAIAVQEGKRDEAVKNYRSALKENPGNGEALLNLGLMMMKEGNYSEAAGYYSKAIELQGSACAAAYYNLAIVSEKQGDREKAAAYYRQALIAEPHYFDAWRNLGLISAGQQRLDEAIAYFSRALKINPRSAEIFKYLGMAFQGKADAGKAVEYYNKSLKLQPDISQAHYYLANLFRESGRINESIDEYEKELKNYPQDQDKETAHLAHYNLAGAYSDIGRYDQAAGHYRQALVFQPDNWDVCNRLAWAILNMDDNTHDLQEALTLAEKACRLTSYQNPIVLITLAMAYRDLRLFDKAIDTAEKARELSSSMRDDKLTAVIRSLLESCVEKRPVVDEAGR